MEAYLQRFLDNSNVKIHAGALQPPLSVLTFQLLATARFSFYAMFIALLRLYIIDSLKIAVILFFCLACTPGTIINENQESCATTLDNKLRIRDFRRKASNTRYSRHDTRLQFATFKRTLV